MLSKFDDFPIHQTVDPIAYTASSDRFTYDRFWYNGHAADGAFYFGISCCRYPNLGILDCGFSLAIDGKQYAFHASSRAPTEPTDLSVGPFQIQILEPMGRHRVLIEANETGIECDLVFTPRTAAIEEGRQTRRNERHLVMDVTRIDQFGFWQGHIHYNGHKLLVDSRNTYGLKDRSWGIRPAGEPYSGGAPLDSHNATHFLWLPIHWQDKCTLAGCFENEHGIQWHNDQVILPAYATTEEIPGVNDPSAVIWQGEIKHQLSFEAGTRRANAATITMNDRSGDTMEITLEPLILHRMKGIGYQHPEWGHGKWHGELAIAGECWSDKDLDPLSFENIHIQQVVIARCGDDVGYGVLEQLHAGPHQRYGFKTWLDGAS